MRNQAQTRGNPFKTRWLGAAVVITVSLVPVWVHAQSADLPPSMPVKAPPSNGLPAYNGYGDPIQSWLAMVSATQAAQPGCMTPLVTVTPRLEQEFRFDFYDQQNGTGSQGNGQHLVNYGGPGGAKIEFIPAYNWEVIVAAPPYVALRRGHADLPSYDSPNRPGLNSG